MTGIRVSPRREPPRARPRAPANAARIGLPRRPPARTDRALSPNAPLRIGQCISPARSTKCSIRVPCHVTTPSTKPSAAAIQSEHPAETNPEQHDVTASGRAHPIQRRAKIAIGALTIERLKSRHDARHVVIGGGARIFAKERVERDDGACVARELRHLSLEIRRDAECGRHDDDRGQYRFLPSAQRSSGSRPCSTGSKSERRESFSGFASGLSKSRATKKTAASRSRSRGAAVRSAIRGPRVEIAQSATAIPEQHLVLRLAVVHEVLFRVLDQLASPPSKRFKT